MTAATMTVNDLIDLHTRWKLAVGEAAAGRGAWPSERVWEVLIRDEWLGLDGIETPRAVEAPATLVLSDGSKPDYAGTAELMVRSIDRVPTDGLRP